MSLLKNKIDSLKSRLALLLGRLNLFKNKPRLPNKQVVLVLFIVALFAGVFYFQKTVAPQKIADIQQTLNVPVRYAFISDQRSNQLAVFDTYSDEVARYLTLAQTPNHIYIDRYNELLLYTTDANDNLYSFNLTSYEEKEIPFNQRIKQIGVVPLSDKIVIETRNGLSLFRLNGSLEKVKTLTTNSTPVVFNITSNMNSAYLVVAENETGLVTRYDLSSDETVLMADLDGEITGVAITPSAQKFAVVDNTNRKLKIYSFIDTKELLSVDLKAKGTRPYITSDGRVVLIVTADNWLYKVDLIDNKVDKFLLNLDEPVINVKSGWLEKNIVLTTKNEILNMDLNSLQLNKSQALSVQQFLVTADSKSVLATSSTDENLIIYSIKDQKFKEVLLDGLKVPAWLVMGQTNTLCH